MPYMPNLTYSSGEPQQPQMALIPTSQNWRRGLRKVGTQAEGHMVKWVVEPGWQPHSLLVTRTRG